jgi:nucleoside-diphosphate-sugar epimerase
VARFLVTGGAGFIGSNLAAKLAENTDNQVTAVDNLSTGFRNYVDKRDNLKFIKADVNTFNDVAGVFYQPYDYVYHYAAVVGVQRTLHNPVTVLKDIDGIKNVLDLAKNTGTKRVFFASSSEVYGEPVAFPQVEGTTPLNSRLPYAIVKNLGEAYLRSYKQEYDLDYTLYRFFNTYGPKQSTDFVMSKFIDAALKDQDITIYGDGSQTRTFCFIGDNVEATINAISDPTALNETINIGNDNEISILELAQKIIQITGSKSKIVHLPPLKEGDMTRRQPDISKMKQLLKREMTSLDDGIRQLIEYRKKLS